VTAGEAEFVERVMRSWIDLVAARDIDGLEAFVAEFFEPWAWIDVAGRPGAGAGVLVDWARDAFAEWRTEGAAFRYELEEVIEAGTGAVVVAAHSAGSVGGSQIGTRFAYLFRVHDQKVLSMRLYQSAEQALADTRIRPGDFTTVHLDRENRWALELDEESGRTFVSIPVSNPYTDYEEYYEIDRPAFDRFAADPATAREFVELAKSRELDHLLLRPPGRLRGEP
jgi:ketosteroid isomerase-like protein